MGILENISSKIDRLELKIDIANKKLDELLDKLNEKPSPPIGEVEPPIEPTHPIEPEPPVVAPLPEEDDTKWFYEQVNTKDYIELAPNQTYRVSTIQPVKLSIPLKIVGDNSTVLIGVENYTPWDGNEGGSLFHLLDGAVFHSKGVNWCIPPQLAFAQRYIPNLFYSYPNTDATWTALVEDCDTTVLGENGGMGLGVNYGSQDGNYLGLINYKHAGGQLMDLKVPHKNDILYLVMKNVTTDYLDKSKFNPTYVKSKVRFTKDFSGFDLEGYYGDHCAEVIEGELFHTLNNQFYNRGWNNRLCMIHIDRFVFWLPSAQFLQKMVDPLCGNKTKWTISDQSTQTNIGSKVLINSIPRVNGWARLGRDYVWNPETKQKDNLSKNKIRSFLNLGIDGDKIDYPIELQPNDVVNIEGEDYTIIHKERGDQYRHTPNKDKWWENDSIEDEFRKVTGEEAQYVFSTLTLDRDLPDHVSDTFIAYVVKSTSEYLLDGKYREAYIAYKGNSSIDLKPNTSFGNGTVLHSKGFGHLSYNHSMISLWAENVKHNGYYRQSSNGKGKTLGYNMIDCEGFENEFNPPVDVTTEEPMPERIAELMK